MQASTELRVAWTPAGAPPLAWGAVTSVCPAPQSDPCPQCQQDDLRPYGNGSKWMCRSCYFLVPCCEGSDLAPSPW